MKSRMLCLRLQPDKYEVVKEQAEKAGVSMAKFIWKSVLAEIIKREKANGVQKN